MLDRGHEEDGVDVRGQRRLLWASCISTSKSEMARNPRTMEIPPCARTASTVRPSNETTLVRSAGRPPRQSIRQDAHPLVDRQEWLLAGIGDDRHDDMVVHREGSSEHIEVSIRHRIERPRVDRDPHADASGALAIR